MTDCAPSFPGPEEPLRAATRSVAGSTAGSPRSTQIGHVLRSRQLDVAAAGGRATAPTALSGGHDPAIGPGPLRESALRRPAAGRAPPRPSADPHEPARGGHRSVRRPAVQSPGPAGGVIAVPRRLAAGQHRLDPGARMAGRTIEHGRHRHRCRPPRVHLSPPSSCHPGPPKPSSPQPPRAFRSCWHWPCRRRHVDDFLASEPEHRGTPNDNTIRDRDVVHHDRLSE
jgi:hypothetical protein